jgi:peptidoglycan/LPS O-acetylase OafA/YrhL
VALIVGGLMAAAAVANWRASRWAAVLSLVAGVALVVFEVVEALSIGGLRSALQPVFFCLALFPLVAGVGELYGDRRGGTAAAPRTPLRQRAVDGNA